MQEESTYPKNEYGIGNHQAPRSGFDDEPEKLVYTGKHGFAGTIQADWEDRDESSIRTSLSQNNAL